jgi:hypothetical protein
MVGNTLAFTSSTSNRKYIMNKAKYIAAVLIGIVGFGLHQAKADTFDYSLSTPNQGISGFTGPYATVHIDLNAAGTAATVTFTSLTNGSNMYLMGNGNAFDLNTNGAATVSGVVFTQAANMIGFSTPSATNLNGSGSVDGFGMFNNTNDTFDGFNNAFSQVAFTLTKNSGTWANAMSVLIANDPTHNALAAAHIFVAMIVGGNVYQSNGALATGFAANGGSTSVPDGGTTVMLLGMGLGALGLVRRYLTS